MSEVTAEMIARGRYADGRSPERRRMANRVREARERLTSSGAGNIVFDMELLRLYAEGRKEAILPQVLLSVAVAAMTTLWMPLTLVGVWLGGVLSALAFNWSLANRYLHQDKAAQKARNWQARFLFAEAANGLAWSSFALLMSGVTDPWATTYVMVVFMLAAAIHTVVTAFLPTAVYAAAGPHCAGNRPLHATDEPLRPDRPADLAGLRHAALFRHSGAAHLCQPARSPAVVPGGKGRADRRARAGQAQFRRGAPARRRAPISPSRASWRR